MSTKTIRCVAGEPIASGDICRIRPDGTVTRLHCSENLLATDVIAQESIVTGERGGFLPITESHMVTIAPTERPTIIGHPPPPKHTNNMGAALAEAWAGADDITRLREQLGSIICDQAPAIADIQRRFERIHHALLQDNTLDQEFTLVPIRWDALTLVAHALQRWLATEPHEGTITHSLERGRVRHTLDAVTRAMSERQ